MITFIDGKRAAVRLLSITTHELNGRAFFLYLSSESDAIVKGGVRPSLSRSPPFTMASKVLEVLEISRSI